MLSKAEMTLEGKEPIDAQTEIDKKMIIIVPQEKPGSWIDWKVLWAFTGPGWLMSMAYLDPGNLESDLQAGAYTGYTLLWVLFWSTVMGLVLQILAARLGVVTGRNLAQQCRENYPRWQSYTLWVGMC